MYSTIDINLPIVNVEKGIDQSIAENSFLET